MAGTALEESGSAAAPQKAQGSAAAQHKTGMAQPAAELREKEREPLRKREREKEKERERPAADAGTAAISLPEASFQGFPEVPFRGLPSPEACQPASSQCCWPFQISFFAFFPVNYDD